MYSARRLLLLSNIEAFALSQSADYV